MSRRGAYAKMISKAGNGMRKWMIAASVLAVMLSGCAKKTKTAEYTGPVAEETAETDQEKELQMIQSCISDYNEQKINDLEKTLQTTIPPLPIGITSLPEISSLTDLTQITPDASTSNTAFIGSYAISDTIDAVFEIFNPSKGSFWLNGKIYFEADPDKVTADNPDFADVRSSLDSLLAEDTEVLNWLYGINVDLGSTEVEPGYYPVTAMGSYHPASIDDIKAIAEKIYTTDFLETNYYQAAFEGDSPVFKEINGQLCCVQTELVERTATAYDTHLILAVQKNDTTTDIDLLTTIQDQVQPVIYRIVLTDTPNGYRLAKNY